MQMFNAFDNVIAYLTSYQIVNLDHRIDKITVSLYFLYCTFSFTGTKINYNILIKSLIN